MTLDRYAMRRTKEVSDFHWKCPEKDCDGWQLTDLAKPNSRSLISSDIALAAITRPSMDAVSEARRRDQASFRRAASLLSNDHDLYAYLSTQERSALSDAATALRKLALAAQHSKEQLKRVEDQREAEFRARNRRQRIEAFARLAGERDPGEVLLRVEALEDFVQNQRGYPEGLGRYAKECRDREKQGLDELAKQAWDHMTQSVGRLLLEDMGSAHTQMTWEGFELFWSDWKAATRLRETIAHAQRNPRAPGGAD